TMSVKEMIAHFWKHDIRVAVPTPLKGKVENVLLFKYIEKCRVWTRWARDCRGTCLMFDGGKWVNIKYQLQRGAEVLTGHHLEAGIDENESMSAKNIEHLDACQRDTVNTLLGNGPIEGA